MNITAIIIGTVIATLVILIFLKLDMKKKGWAYLLLLASFPFYYWVFALTSQDYSALILEAGIGLIFFLPFFLYTKIHYIKFLYILGVGYLLHSTYDIFHYLFFTNNGSPTWWPEFCGAVDPILGVYLIVYAVLLPGSIAAQENR